MRWFTVCLCKTIQDLFSLSSTVRLSRGHAQLVSSWFSTHASARE
jgi:hypothetical protein